MKRFLFVLGVAFWVIAEPAYAQYYIPSPGGPVPVWSNPGYLNQPGVQAYAPGPSPYLPGQHTVFQQFYDPVCHYAPGVWGWRQECF
jgi:hypothetical protein